MAGRLNRGDIHLCRFAPRAPARSVISERPRGAAYHANAPAVLMERLNAPSRILRAMRVPMRSPAALVVMLLLGSSSAGGGDSDWPQFRGPEANPAGGDGRLPEHWSTTENVEWSVEIPGRGWSSPIVTAGKVFVTTVTTEGKSKPPQTGTEYSNEYAAELIKQGLTEAQALERVTARDIEMPSEVMLHYFLYCLDLKTGAVLWKKEMHSGRPPGGRHRKNSFVSETPVTDGKFVYVYAGNLGLYAYDLDGEQVWGTPLEAYPIYLDFGTGGSPALHGNQLLILNDNEKQQFIAAFDKRTGKRIWRTERDVTDAGGPPRRSGWTTPFVWSNKLRTEVVTIGPGVAVSYDLAGNELWRLSGMSAVPAPSPFAYDGLLYIDAGQTRPLFAIRPGASGDISLKKADEVNEYVAWSEPRAGTYIPTPVAYEGGLYVLYDKGILGRFDAKTGKLTYKARIDREAGAFTSSPWAYNGKVFCLSEEGKTYVVAAGEVFKLLHVNPLGEMALATPAIAGERLLIRTEAHLYSIRRTR
ncbi:MAG: PQQ-binding-like beta-propeller repeat protein [Bryobacteraceae bacterium]